ncbi:MAG: CPBP family intramembrane glutamic endopeptidase [Eubacterium sp.]|nr:CPBP family intramembrane glutamic endopeptidase [Eubacterium sp.]
MKEKCKAIAWSGLYLVIELASLTLLSFILSFIVMVAGIQLGMFSADQMQNFQGVLAKLIQYIQQGNPLMILNFVQELITLACFGLWYYFREKKYQYRPNYKKAFSIKNVLSIAGIAFLGQYALNLLMILVYFVMPGIFAQYVDLMKNLEINAANPVLMIFCVGIFGPLVEEVLFRGMVFGKLRRVFSFWPAALISGAIFGLYHMNLVQGIYAGVFGIILAYVFEKTETIWGCYLLHALFNLSSYVIEGYETALRSVGFEMPVLIQLLFGFVSVFVIVLLLKNFKKRAEQ